ncbi:573_t:CDS:2 [Gigaspora margarita]|uniref:573_t:CDS:1 n=1 Tax=Gigaspora margarita TaxID=4874 RepID=A0ABN7VEN0_GIGMA|nr:573_t:CDS:2 [Gigaspora margarita]
MSSQQVDNNGISKRKDEFFKDEKSQIEKEAKTAYKRDLNITTKIEPTVTTPSRKVILELLEYQGLKQAEEIEEFIKNRHKEVIVKEVNDSLGPKSKNIPSSILQKGEVYNFTLWNIPKEVQVNRIRRCFNFYGKATIVRTQEHKKTKAVYIQLTSRIISRIDALKKA